ncbi:hypothetical protein [Chromohalobacter israelensis]|uniref:hypothetical protein n=1 Tax=Chromohalobacter israelensis TaxID=141390 RepID=UPI000FFEDC3F|nr:hypothetical protein [Chromohalobacter salexigens]RXE47039.1 hypothetical protein B4O83_03110 [Chromohalobacter salexigens]
MVFNRKGVFVFAVLVSGGLTSPTLMAEGGGQDHASSLASSQQEAMKKEEGYQQCKEEGFKGDECAQYKNEAKHAGKGGSSESESSESESGQGESKDGYSKEQPSYIGGDSQE